MLEFTDLADCSPTVDVEDKSVVCVMCRYVSHNVVCGRMWYVVCGRMWYVVGCGMWSDVVCGRMWYVVGCGMWSDVVCG
jgi:hypothetical protein